MPVSSLAHSDRETPTELSRARSVSAPSLCVWCPFQQHVKNTLVDARQRHYDAVKEKIDKIGQMNDSVELTQSLFALSKVRPPAPFLLLRWTERARILTTSARSPLLFSPSAIVVVFLNTTSP